MTRRLCFVLCALVSAGCSQSTTASNVPIEMVGTLYADALCSAIHTCYGDTIGAFVTGAPSQAACQHQAELAFEDGALPRFQAAIAMGTLTYDGSQAAACQAATMALGCGIVSSRSPAACRAMFVGHVAPGGACALDEECMGDAYCSVDTACPGSCQARVTSGGACTRDAACADGLRCASGHCSTPALEGASCQGTTGVDCAGGMICAGGSSTANGTCRSVATIMSGAAMGACNLQQGQFCMAGLSCEVAGITSMTCVTDGIAVGMPCHLSLPDECAEGAYCNGPDISRGVLDGTCAPLPTAGQPCATVVAGLRCAVGAHCNAMNNCATVQETGGACTEDGDCFSGRCASGACVAPGYCN